jgi:serine/threonine protein kinase
MYFHFSPFIASIGSFGKVFLVRDKANGSLYAMKVLKKDYIIRKNQVEHTKTERSVLGYVHHPFIVGLNMAFQTADKLFFVLDYCSGGELFFHLGKVGRFPESRSKFYAAQIVLALEYVHKLGIIYRYVFVEFTHFLSFMLTFSYSFFFFS